MMKIAKSLVVIVTVAALAVGASSAIFTDREQITGNTFATGSVNITLNKSAGKPFIVSNAYPGYQTGWEYMDIFNSPGTLPVEAYIWLSQSSGSAALYNALEIDLVDSGWDSTCGNGDDVTIYSGLLTGITGQANRTQSSDNDPNGSGTPGNDDIRVGWSERVCQRLRLPSTAGDELESLTTAFTEVVDAEQNND